MSSVEVILPAMALSCVFLDWDSGGIVENIPSELSVASFYSLSNPSDINSPLAYLPRASLESKIS